jgi:multiple sugar transport system ATP-binding protein
MTTVTLEKIVRRYRDMVAVECLDLEIRDKEFVVLLGPSGCGKTTTLNLIAGMDSPTSGHIYFDGKPVEGIPPETRNIAMVFQSIALYPHKTVYENIAFPLRMTGVPRAEIDQRVRAAAALMRIGELLNRKPHELSGGQRQRVALGRAAVRNPVAFLFDEPLSALDAKLRTEMRVEIKKLHERLDSTFIYVTHDQIEALTMADRIAVMNDGRLMQYAPPDEIYRRPANVTVARFVGSPGMNLVSGTIGEDAGTLRFRGGGIDLPLAGALGAAARTARASQVILGIRPEALSPEAGDIAIGGSGRVYAIEPLGSDQFVDVAYTPGDAPDLVKVRTRPDIRFTIGQPLTLKASSEALYLFAGDGPRLYPATAP